MAWARIFVGGLGPCEGLAALVPAVDEGADGCEEAAAADGLASDDAKEDLDHVQGAAAG